ncbi:hypothetical protein HOP62_04780 [Halomonas sp. MCCC 1A17488]|uniref:DUF2459 domain-containing protein n=1 Tax=Billgrantia sulfidoxydans TaxID=2733484 RepID=A0ABX7W3X3_9GAMM|nr:MULTISPECIES: hypothetical protein [Halomonas]MCE8015389.1 hypothetical protein [Halomonas sp. MCCC 1A17488]MCG3238722.1 hypothetical protein [Halomonas sp. MCCC 1A17488]QPP51309.1 hypothetical protein I4484_09620 [Halomonas sp. SS10-MC5]QTP54865.1 hypothetical protein HNO51_09330 [Halomonas sulfidoxydans]
MCLLLAGCVGHVLPPEPSSLDRPVEVYVLDHGRHASLVLPREEGGMVRYSYGEWRWYVEGRRHWPAGAAAMLWPTASGLGRGEYPGVDSPEQFHRLAPEGLDEVYPIQAEAGRVLALRRRLDGHFERAAVEPVPSEEFGLAFVPHPRKYSAVHQSNLVVARWLRALDVEVRGSPWFSRWRVEPP